MTRDPRDPYGIPPYGGHPSSKQGVDGGGGPYTKLQGFLYFIAALVVFFLYFYFSGGFQ